MPAAPPGSAVPDNRLLLVDYGTHLEVLIANLMIGEPNLRAALIEHAELENLASWRCINLLCRPTRKEAEEFYYYIIHENGDWVAVEEALAMRSKGGASSSKLPTHTKERMIFASGTYPFVGSYDDVVEEFRQMSACLPRRFSGRSTTRLLSNSISMSHCPRCRNGMFRSSARCAAPSGVLAP